MRPIGEIVRDNIWQFVGVITAIVFGCCGILVTCSMFFFFQREVKQLELVVLVNTSLIQELEGGVAEDITVLYRDQPISNISVVQVKLGNHGNSPIREEDYTRPLEFIFPLETQIVEAIVLESSPPNIEAKIQTEQNIAVMSPVLLNPEDRVVIRFLVINMPANSDTQPFTVDARIIGVQDLVVTSVTEERERQWVTTEFYRPLLYFQMAGSAIVMVFVTVMIIGYAIYERIRG